MREKEFWNEKFLETANKDGYELNCDINPFNFERFSNYLNFLNDDEDNLELCYFLSIYFIENNKLLEEVIYSILDSFSDELIFKLLDFKDIIIPEWLNLNIQLKTT